MCYLPIHFEIFQLKHTFSSILFPLLSRRIHHQLLHDATRRHLALHRRLLNEFHRKACRFLRSSKFNTLHLCNFPFWSSPCSIWICSFLAHIDPERDFQKKQRPNISKAIFNRHLNVIIDTNIGKYEFVRIRITI